MKKNHTPYLIQRLTARTYGADDRKGVDRYFAMDYMGSAEFEFGAVPQALKTMRQAMRPSWQPKKMNAILPDSVKHTAWYVGPPEMYSTALDLFKSELEEKRKYRLKERTLISQRYRTNKYGSKQADYYDKFVGWWDVTEGSPYAFFVKKEQAEKWLKGLRDVG